VGDKGDRTDLQQMGDALLDVHYDRGRVAALAIILNGAQDFGARPPQTLGRKKARTVNPSPDESGYFRSSFKCGRNERLPALRVGAISGHSCNAAIYRFFLLLDHLVGAQQY
jgi:hypothetical protein